MASDRTVTSYPFSIACRSVDSQHRFAIMPANDEVRDASPLQTVRQVGLESVDAFVRQEHRVVCAGLQVGVEVGSPPPRNIFFSNMYRLTPLRGVAARSRNPLPSTPSEQTGRRCRASARPRLRASGCQSHRSSARCSWSASRSFVRRQAVVQQAVANLRASPSSFESHAALAADLCHRCDGAGVRVGVSRRRRVRVSGIVTGSVITASEV
jgi:hypothetical protein